MGVISLTRYATQPGQLAHHVELHLEALQRLRSMGLAAMGLQPVAGSDVGSLAMAVNYPNYAAYTTSIQTMAADQGWQEFYGAAMGSGAATQVESSLFADLDPAFEPAADRPLGVVASTQWKAFPGRLADFVDKVMEAGPHTERMGGGHRPMQSLMGQHTFSMMIANGFEDLDAYGAYADTSSVDPEFQAVWAAAMSDPPAELVRSGLYINMG